MESESMEISRDELRRMLVQMLDHNRRSQIDPNGFVLCTCDECEIARMFITVSDYRRQLNDVKEEEVVKAALGQLGIIIR